MKRKLFIFGGFGFIGLNLNDQLHKNFNIILVGKNRNNHKPLKCKKVEANIFDFNLMESINFNNSIIIMPILHSRLHMKSFKKKFQKLMDLLVAKNFAKLILLSSASVYGSSNKVINENSHLKIKSKYTKACNVSENICLKVKNKKIMILRICNLFGFFRYKPAFIEKIIENHFYNSRHRLNDQNLIRTYLSIKEFSKIIKKIINNDFKKKIYNIANPNNIKSSKSIINFFKNKLNIRADNFIKQKVLIKNSIISSKLFEKDYNFNFQNSFENDLKKLVKKISYKKLK